MMMMMMMMMIITTTTEMVIITGPSPTDVPLVYGCCSLLASYGKCLEGAVSAF
jgi:hypothetical protein